MASPLKIEQYDLLICGGGTAGCVLANRLTEDPNLTVLMLEAGENLNEDSSISTPGLFPLNMDNPQRDWQFMAEESRGLYGRRIAHPRGKCIGGSSAINLMAIVHPSQASLNAWAELGNQGWDWSGVGPYYQKYQRHFPPSKDVAKALSMGFLDPELRNQDGPIAASYPRTVDPIQKAWVDTWKGLEKHLAGDPLEGKYVGGYISAAAIDPIKGERSHAGVEYYSPIASRPNVHVVTGATINRIELDDSKADSVVATGVKFTYSGHQYVARSTKEIILSAGTFGSPAILERSGIGGKSLCEKLGIKNIIDNPSVGENFQDHVACGMSYEVKDGISTVESMQDPGAMQNVMEEYQTSKSGPLAGGAGYSFAYTPLLDFITPFSREELRQLLDKYLPVDSEPKFKAGKRHYAFTRSIIESPHEASASLCLINVQIDGSKLHTKDVVSTSEPGNYVSLIPQLAHPFSRGSVHIESADPNVHPKITPNYLEHPLDAEILGRHLMQCETFVNTQPFSDLLKPNGRRLPKGKDALTLENAIDVARGSSTSNWHPCGTCAMMPEELGGVVDSRLKVHGVKGLRVCDASIFPIQVRGNIMSTVYAVAEKGSDILKEDLNAQA